MSTKEILLQAYVGGLVPIHLHGRTQHKTLTARLSTDILTLRDRSRFFRPWPGRFFLTEFLNDVSLPIEFRSPIIARRRARQLKKEYAAFLDFEDAELIEDGVSKHEFSRLVKLNKIRYQIEGAVSSSDSAIWIFSIVTSGDEVLSYRRGRFDDGRNIFGTKRTIGFSSPLTQNDKTLFDQKFHGVVSAAISTVAIDLDLEFSTAFQEIERSSRLIGCVKAEAGGRNFLLAVCEIRMPKGFVISTRRLAINDLAWHSFSDLAIESGQFDDWSYSVRKLVV